jgi:D-lactate dehydrogenase (cytochrome)
VPISRLAECLLTTKEDIQEAGLIAPIVGHVGDGNFHVQFLVEPGTDEIDRAREVNGRMIARALDMGGTCTGEHGIGIGKLAYLEAEHGAGVDVMRQLKRALDPANLMNPGKVVSIS